MNNKSNSTLALREGMSLIDRVVFYGIDILGFTDPGRLIHDDLLEGYQDNYDENRDHFVYKCRSEDGQIGQVFKRLKLSDDIITLLSARNTNYGESCTLQITIDDSSGTNVSCWTVEEYSDYIQRVQQHLEEEYGILTDFSDMKMKSIELNRTFLLNGKFEDYHRVFQLIMNRLAYPMCSEMDYRYNGKDQVYPGTYLAKSTTKSKETRYTQFKIYNKTSAIQEIITVVDNVMRAEITLSGSDRIKKELGTNQLTGLTDQIVSDYYDRWIEKFVIKPLKKWQRESLKTVKKIIQEEQANTAHWKVNSLLRIENTELSQQYPLILDVADLNEVFKKLTSSQTSYARIKKTFRKQAKQRADVLTQRDDKKLQEILDKLTIHSDAITTLTIVNDLEKAS